MGMGFDKVNQASPYSDRESANLFDLLGFEDILKNLEVGDKLIFVLSIHLDSRHLHVA